MLRVGLVGELRLELDGREIAPPAGRRARSLLAWLAYHPGLHPRTRVASVFWPDVLERSSRASLRTTLATLRRDIGEAAAAGIVAGRDRVGIDDDAGVWVDVREAARLEAAGRAAEALALCDGDLLTDLDDDWVLEARQAHRDRVGALLAGLGDAAEAAGDPGAAAELSRRRLQLDPSSEDAARLLMRRLAAAGDGAAAVAAYEAFRGALRRELGMVPSAATRELAARLRAEGGVAAAAAPAAPIALPDALSPAARGPLVGRAGPLAALRAAWQRASAGAASAVVVTGEAGSGKTRLLAELAAGVREGGGTVLAGRCPEDVVAAFAPVAEALRPYVAADPGALPGWAVAELARLLPELGTAPPVAAAGTPDGRHRLYEAVAAVLGHAARRGPVLLVVEDLHQADPATLGLLAHVVRAVGWAPLLVVASVRAGAETGPALPAFLDEARRHGGLERVTLDGLDPDEVEQLATAWLGAAPPPGLAAVLHGRTGGNPLFVEELVRHLAESRPGAIPADLVAAAEDELPLGVRTVIDRRLARLDAAAAEAVRVAAVAGEEFGLADVAAAAGVDDGLLAARLDAALAAGLVAEAAAPGRYRFAHALVRDTVLAGMSATRRAVVHRDLARALRALPEPERARRSAALARHLLDARPLVGADEAAGAALAAARAAIARLAYEDAADLLGRALRDDLDPAGRTRAEVLLALGDALRRAGDGPAADAAVAAAAGAARALGDAELLARAALGAAGLAVAVAPVREDVRALLEEALAGLDAGSALRPRVLARLAIELYYEPGSPRERLSAEALAGARRAGGPALREALGARHVALWSPAHTEERLAIADELVAEARAAGDREAELQGVNWRVADLFELGDRTALDAAIDAHDLLAGELRLPSFAWYAPMWRATLALLGGQVDEALRLSEQGARIGSLAHDDNAALLFGVQRRSIRVSGGGVPDEDDRAVLGRAIERSPARLAWRAARGLWAAVAGDDATAAEELKLGVDELAEAPLDANWLYAANCLGVVAARLGDAAAAEALYAPLRPFAARVVTVGRGCFCAGSAALSLGLLAATRGDRRAAEAHLEDAVAANDALGATVYAEASRGALAGLRSGAPPQAAALAAELLRGP